MLRSKIALLVALMIVGSPAIGAEVIVNISNVVNAKGHLVVAICNRSDFPRRCSIVKRQSAVAPISTVSFENVASGTYAIAVFHDENDDGKFNVDANGIPLEGFGFSRDAVGHFGPPSFDDAAVAIGDQSNRFQIALSY